MTRQKTVLSLALAAFALGGVAAYLILRKPVAVDPVPRPEGAWAALPVLGAVPEFSLTDADGTTVGLNELLGRAWVANFMFTRCGETCPAQSRNLADLQAKIGDAPLKDKVRLVSFTLDPDHDTAKVLTEYAAHHKARAGFWHFLSGPADDVIWLSRKGFRLPAERAKGKAMPAHSQQFALVDPWGQIRGYYDGTSATAMEKLRGDLELASVEAAPTADPIAESAAMRDPRQKLEPELHNPAWLRTRWKEQTLASLGWSVFHDFGFSDRLDESGITFRHRVVDDASNLYKPVHYDHGNGLIAADVDGDGLMDLYFVNQVGPCQLWRNKGGGKFEDITAKAGVGLAEPIKVTAAFVDVNNDGAPDLYVTTVRGGNRLFLNDGKGVFKDATEGSGLGLTGHFSAPVFFDYDRDGLVDLYLCDVGTFTTENLLPVTPFGPAVVKDEPKYQFYEAYKDAFSGHLKPERAGRCRMFRNLGNGKFADVTKELGFEYTGWTGDATPIDANGDGWPDLYVLNMQGDNEYYENDGGRRFVRKSRAVFPNTPWGAMGAKAFDFDNDGKFDLLLTDMHSDMSALVGPTVAEEKRKSKIAWPESFLATGGRSIFGNALFRAKGGGKFEEVSDAAGVETFWPWGPSVGDLNADGFQDVFVTAGMGYPYRYGINSLLLNDGGRQFRDSEFVLGVEPRRGWRTAMPWFERKGNPSRPLTEWGALSTRSAIMIDLDDDGDLDIVTSEFGAEPMVLISNLTERKKVRFLKVRLIGGMTADAKGAGPATPGAKSNRDGLGAVVRVRCGTRNFVQCHDGRSGYLSQGLLPLYFGLGDADTIDEVDVTWPSGKKQTLPGPVKVNSVVTVREGE